MKVTKIWCEWGIGINEGVFATETLARKKVDEALKECGLYGLEGIADLDSFIDVGLVGFETVEVIEE